MNESGDDSPEISGTTSGSGAPEPLEVSDAEASGAPTTSGTPTSSPEPPPLPSLPRRCLDVVFSPGRLFEALREQPAWVAALVLGTLLAALQTALIPADVWAELQRQMALQKGVEVPEMGATMATVLRYVTPVLAAFGWFVMSFLFAGIVAVIFAFILGDEGRYRQYLAVYAHAMLIPAVVGVLLVPLRIAQRDPRFTINLGAFFFFLPEGYLHRLLNVMDLTQLWAWVLVGLGAHAIHPRRSVTSAVTIALAIALASFAVAALLTPPA